MLAKHALTVASDTRAALLLWTARDLVKAARRIAGMAEGDYSPDPDATRRPTFSSPSTKPPPVSAARDEKQGRFALSQVIADYFTELQDGGRRADRGRIARKRWQPIFDAFAELIGKDDIRDIEPTDVVRWKDHRIASGISTSTVAKVDLPALKAVFGWAASNGRIPSNRVQVRVTASRAPITRERGFTDAEAETVLSTALSRKAGPRELLQTVAAFRWMPWLLAYTGARVAEIAQLRKEDIDLSAKPPTLRITPEAGSVKANAFRIVPLHPHLMQQGFGAFVKGSKNGPLFHVAGTKASTIAGKITAAVRKIVPDKAVQPNHGWRHRFKTIARERGFDPRIVDAIQGHAARTAGEGYGDVTPKAMMSGVISRIPAYKTKSATS